MKDWMTQVDLKVGIILENVVWIASEEAIKKNQLFV